MIIFSRDEVTRGKMPLVIRCTRCKAKLFQYLKIGKGAVLRCYKARVGRRYDLELVDGEVRCKCGNVVGTDKPGYFQMRQGTFYHTGSKL